MTCQIDRYQPAGRAELDPAVTALLNRLDAERPLADEKFASRETPWRIAGVVCFVARCDGEPVGFLSGRLRPEGHYGLAGRSGFVELVGVLPGHRCDPGQMTSGERLVRAFGSYAAGLGCSNLMLRVDATPEEEQKTRAFFVRLGFKPLSTKSGYEYRPITP